MISRSTIEANSWLMNSSCGDLLQGRVTLTGIYKALSHPCAMNSKDTFFFGLAFKYRMFPVCYYCVGETSTDWLQSAMGVIDFHSRYLDNSHSKR